MSRLVLCLVVFAAIAVAASDGLAVTRVLKQGIDGYSGSTDTYIDQDSPTGNYGNLWYMHLYIRSDDPERSDLIYFDLTNVIPAGSVIQNATLSVWLYQVVDMTSSDWISVGPYRIRSYRDWMETQATWNCFKTNTYWSAAGCENTSWDRYADPDDYVYFYNTSPVNAYYHWDVTPSVQAWAAGAHNCGWLLRAQAHDGGSDGLSFNAKESSSAYRPYLTIVYEPPIAVEQATWGSIKALFE